MRTRFAVLALTALVALSATVLLAQQNITVKGSDTLVILGQRWAETYMQKNPGVTIQVTGGGSGTGIAALINGTTNVAESSRSMKDKEIQEVKTKQGKDVLEIPVAVDGLAVYVHENNPVNELSIPQIRGIYTGAIRNWNQVGGPDARIILYSRENNSGTYVYFKEHVLDNADFFPTAQTLPGTAAVINAVSKDPRGIGYGGIAYGKGIKHLKVKKDANSPAVDPTMENVLTGTYPVSRPLFWYLAGQPAGQLRAFVAWVISPEGQKVVENVGYYPLSESARRASVAKLESGSRAAKSGS